MHRETRPEGHTSHSAERGTTHANKPLQESTIRELRQIAGELNIRGRARMKKEELLRAIHAAKQRPQPATGDTGSTRREPEPEPAGVGSRS